MKDLDADKIENEAVSDDNKRLEELTIERELTRKISPSFGDNGLAGSDVADQISRGQNRYNKARPASSGSLGSTNDSTDEPVIESPDGEEEEEDQSQDQDQEEEEEEPDSLLSEPT